MGRLDEALSQLQRAVELDPLSANYNACLGYLYYAKGQSDLAIAQHRRAMDLDPGFCLPHWLLAVCTRTWEVRRGDCRGSKGM